MSIWTSGSGSGSGRMMEGTVNEERVTEGWKDLDGKTFERLQMLSNE